MSNIADRVRTAQDKDGMLRRALERIIQLYTDKSHFVYELLQNAEDAEAKNINAKLTEIGILPATIIEIPNSEK